MFAVDDLHFQRALPELVVLEYFVLCKSLFCKYCFGGDVNLVFRKGRNGVKTRNIVLDFRAASLEIFYLEIGFFNGCLYFIF